MRVSPDREGWYPDEVTGGFGGGHFKTIHLRHLGLWLFLGVVS
jgi:hypothetical protein